MYTALSYLLRAFQSTPSAWRETKILADYETQLDISIHSLRMEGDLLETVIFTVPAVISIHSLRMEGDIRIHVILPW